MKSIEKVMSVEQRVSKNNNNTYWYVLTENECDVFSYEEVKVGDLICIDTRHTYFGKVNL